MSDAIRTRNRLKLALIFTLFSAPIVAAYVVYHFWQPQKYINYGELIQPKTLPQSTLTQIDGTTFQFSQLKGKWIFFTIGSGHCDADCNQNLYKMRQVRLTQGKDMDRVEQVWLIDDTVDPSPDLIKQDPQMWIVKADHKFLNELAQGKLNTPIFLVDPIGNLMLRYGRDADPRKMVKDMVRLLKVSQVG